MRKEKKVEVIENLVGLLDRYPNFYLADIEALPADKTSALRRKCFESDVKLVVVKNTLLKLALEQTNSEVFQPLYVALKGNTAVMFSENANAPAKLIKDFAKENKPTDESKKAKPELKGAYVQECVYVGAEHLETLIHIKSKEELIGDVLLALTSPIQSVVSSLESAGGTIHGLLSTLEERDA